jgi:hypothetical protein
LLPQRHPIGVGPKLYEKTAIEPHHVHPRPPRQPAGRRQLEEWATLRSGGSPSDRHAIRVAHDIVEDEVEIRERAARRSEAICFTSPGP